MKTVNSKKDLESLTQEEYDRFMNNLSHTIKKWKWDSSQQDWVLYEDTRSIERLGLKKNDFDDIPEPPKPDYNPEEKEKQSRRDELAQEAKRLLDQVYDPQINEYERDKELEQTPSAESRPYTYTTLDGTDYEGKKALLHWANDLRSIIRDAKDGSLSPDTEVPMIVME